MKLSGLDVVRLSEVECKMFDVPKEKRNIIKAKLFCSDEELPDLQKKIGQLLSGDL